MFKRSTVALKQTALIIALFGANAVAHGQSPYGLAARQTIPWVVDHRDERGTTLWETEIDIHNPGSVALTVEVSYRGAVGSATPGEIWCGSKTLAPRETSEFQLFPFCNLNPGPQPNYGRLELTALLGKAEDDALEPSQQVFLASARVRSRQIGGSFFTVEGFPEGYLSGNKRAVATGLKSGFVNGAQWGTVCGAAGLNDQTGVLVRLLDGSGNQIGNSAFFVVDPSSNVEMQVLKDVFAAVGAPPGNYSNVRAEFAATSPFGPGVFAFCMIVNASDSAKRAFEVAKYLDNNDDGRQYLTQESHIVVSEILRNHSDTNSNLHLAYFQHPDRVTCTVRWGPSTYIHFTPDQLQMRLIDSDGQAVSGAGGPHAHTFTFDLEEKPGRHRGRNGRWLVEVAPDRAFASSCGELCSGGLDWTPYTLTCASGNGHNVLDITGHCRLDCTKDSTPGSTDSFCAFDQPFDPSRCQVY